MAKVKAKVSFAGLVTMGAGEVKDIESAELVKDLISAGYVEECKSSSAPQREKAKKRVMADEN